MNHDELARVTAERDALRAAVRELIEDLGDWVLDHNDKTYHFVIHITTPHVRELERLAGMEQP